MIRSKVLIQLVTRQLQNLDSDAVTSSEFAVSRCSVGSVACLGHSICLDFVLLFFVVVVIFLHFYCHLISFETVSFMLTIFETLKFL